MKRLTTSTTLALAIFISSSKKPFGKQSDGIRVPDLDMVPTERGLV